MAKKPLKHYECREVLYNVERWTLLKKLREKAANVMQALRVANIDPVVHGSIARGDVNLKSDLDIFVPVQTSSFSIENALQTAGFSVNDRLIVQATPTYAMKAHITIDEKVSISFPLMAMRRVEREFYRFGGEANLEDLKCDNRVLGVDKRLMMIEPTSEGHMESSIVGQEEAAAKLLRISVDTVLNRVHALLRRDNIGRTGVFLKKEVNENESFEMALKALARTNPAVRRRLADSFKQA